MTSLLQRRTRVAVLGAGVIGLTTAIRLADAGYEVCILADRFSPSTDSDASCAIFLPIFSYKGNETDYPQRIIRWANTSGDRFIGMDFDLCGVRKIAAMELYAKQEDVHPYASEVLRNCRVNHRPELPNGYQWVLEFETLIIEMPKYMKWLIAECDNRLVSYRHAYFERIEDIRKLDVDVVINCLGLGAKRLLEDPELRSVRGQIILHPPVALDIAIGGGLFCLYPRSDALVIGSLWFDGSEAELPSEEGYTQLVSTLEFWKGNILNKLNLPFDSIQIENALATLSGRRPVRTSVRLEKDTENHVIHNYGHGGIGVSLSWGCADEVLKVLAEF
jgi:D-amino-acid oxidase